MLRRLIQQGIRGVQPGAATPARVDAAPAQQASGPSGAPSFTAAGNAAVWAIGDVHGCCRSLDALLASPEIADDPGCRFWFVGDLVNRGPDSAQTLRRVMALGDRATVVLGNHDLRALAIAAGCIRPGRQDTMADLFDAPDADALLDWLRRQPLMHAEGAHVLAHAGIFPAWDLPTAAAVAAEAEALLRDDRWRTHMRALWGPAPLAWDPQVQGRRRLRFIAGAFTRMRLCTRQGGLAPGAKTTPGHWPRGTMPWFDVPGRLAADRTIVFGHWATLGLVVRADVVCLDTGCVTGGPLTAYRLSDRKLVQVPRDAVAPDESTEPLIGQAQGQEHRRTQRPERQGHPYA